GEAATEAEVGNEADGEADSEAEADPEAEAEAEAEAEIDAEAEAEAEANAEADADAQAEADVDAEADAEADADAEAEAQSEAEEQADADAEEPAAKPIDAGSADEDARESDRSRREADLAGPVMRFESDRGVTTRNGNVVTDWLGRQTDGQSGRSDASGRFVALGAPRLLLGALNGLPIIRFEGDSMEGADGLEALPLGDEDRSLYLVVRYQSNGSGGLAWSDWTGDRAFGIGVGEQGLLRARVGDPEQNLVSPEPGVGRGWLVHAVVYEAGQLSHYVNGNLIDTRIHALDTAAARLVLGADAGSGAGEQGAGEQGAGDQGAGDQGRDDAAGRIAAGHGTDGSANGRMDVAAVLIYDRALGPTEHDQVTRYLEARYGIGDGEPRGDGVAAPVANDDAAVAGIGESVTIDVLANDVDPDGALEQSTLLLTAEPSRGVAIVDADGSVTYSPVGSSGGTDSLRYVVYDDSGLVSNEALVTIEVTAEN
ncbi:MAG: hypothetical protein JXB36_18465, partial [Gammaproteobacteria bacterium]|nr:hypothetical protein [Gammaproteobacteria bacterium]